VLAGDPCQLPPVIATPALVADPVTPSQHAPSGARLPRPQGLLRPMFVRLADLGHQTHLLHTQYRLGRLRFIYFHLNGFHSA